MAAVEESLDRSLKGRPFVVARPDVSRAVVLDLSTEAYRQGIRRGMLAEAARYRSRDLAMLPPRRLLYEKLDTVLAESALRFTPLVEEAGRGHLFFGCAGDAVPLWRAGRCGAAAVARYQRQNRYRAHHRACLDQDGRKGREPCVSTLRICSAFGQ